MPEAQQQPWFWEGKGGLTLAQLWLTLVGDFWMTIPTLLGDPKQWWLSL